MKDLKLDLFDSNFFEDDVDSEMPNCNVSGGGGSPIWLEEWKRGGGAYST